MNIQPLHAGFITPTKGTEKAGAYDLYMPEAGKVYPHGDSATFVGLGFAAEVPEGHVALLLPRSGTGAKKGLELNNTCGVIDSDYRGEFIAALRVKNAQPVEWEAGERLLQMLIVPVANVSLKVVDQLSDTERGQGGFGSSGN